MIAAVAVSLSSANVSARINPAHQYGDFPFQFEANRGQAALEYGFLARGPGYGLMLKPSEAVLSLKSSDAENTQSVALRMELMGADPKARLRGDAPLPGKINYLRGRDAKQWQTGVPTYAKVKASGVYPGIDLVYYGNPKQLEYDFIVKPGADPKQIRWRFETRGQKAAALPHVDARGELVVPSATGELRFHKPVIYQEIQGRKQPVNGRFVAKTADFGRAAFVAFEVGRYDHSQILVIDPVLGYSTFLGGERNEEGNAIAVDGSGNAYIGGEAEFGFPVTVGAYDTTYNGDKDAFIAKLDPTGSQLVYATYLGVVGTGNILNSADDVVNAIAVDSAGQVYAAGKAGAGGTGPFPTTPGVFEPDCDGGNNFIVKLNATGSNLVYSTCVNTVSIRGIAVDGAGYAYIGGSSGSCGFFKCPLTTGAYDTTPNGSNDAFVGKLNPTGTGFVFGTLIGGAREDIGRGVAVDSLGNVYVTGSTKSTDFPTTAGALDTDANDADLNRDNDAFVAKLDPTGASLIYSTYLGGLDEDSGQSIAVDAANNAYVTGGTESANFPTTAGAFSTRYSGFVDAFVAKLNPAGSGLVYSTYLGGNLRDSGAAIAVDAGGNAYIVGDTRSANFPLVDAPDTAIGGGSWEAFVTKLNAAGTGLVYSSYLGGDSVELGRAIALDSAGNAYVTGYTVVANFPTTVGALDTVNNGYDAFVVKLVDAAVPPPPPPPPPTISADLSLQVSAKRSAKAGRVLTYRLRVSNKTKRVSAPSVTVAAQLPAGISVAGIPALCSQSGANLACALGEIKARRTKALTIKVRPSNPGQITFKASVSGFVNDGNSANNSVTVTTRVR